MSDELVVDGVSYISSKRAAQATGYAQDHVGYLARTGQVEARRIGGLWYVSADSLQAYKQKADSYKPQPPQARPPKDPDSIISLDGKDYISASRAAEMTGYHQDYVGQLAREGKVLSRQIGNRWYVERTGVVGHKKEKDALLGAVQAEAVGLSTRVAAKDGHPERLENSKYNGTSSYFTYTDDNGDLMPLSAESSSDFPDTPEESATFGEEDKDEVSTAVEHKIPIRVLEASSGIAQMGSKNPPMPQKLVPESWKPALSWATGALATVVIVLTIGYVSVSTNALYARMVPDSSSALVNRASDALSRIAEILESWIAPEVVYRRDN